MPALERSQARAESRMRDMCTATRQSAAPGTLDAETGWPTVGAATTVYVGKCRLRMGAAVSGSTSRDVAGDKVSMSQPVLSIPVSAPRLLVGDVVVIDGVPNDDPAGHLRLGIRCRVVGLVLNQDATAQRVTVEAVTG